VAMSPVWQASIILRTFSIGNDWHPDGSDVDSDVDSNDSAAVAVIVVIVELSACIVTVEGWDGSEVLSCCRCSLNK